MRKHSGIGPLYMEAGPQVTEDSKLNERLTEIMIVAHTTCGAGLWGIK